MKKIIYLLIISAIFTAGTFAQSIEDVKAKLESFDYEEVINLTNKLLSSDPSLKSADKIELLTMKAVSFYSLSNIDSSRAAFIDLLKLDNTHELNQVRTSPKIVTFYNSVKNEFMEISLSISGADDDEMLQEDTIVFNSGLFTNSVVRSLVIPGWGHLHAKGSAGNWLYTIISSANLGSMIYFIIDTNNKEQKYLNESDLTKMTLKYNDYNSAYKTRNILIGTFAAMWIYSQIDLLFNSDDLFMQKVSPAFSIRKFNSIPDYTFTLTLNF